jgi:hypothetical protein
MGQQQHTPNRAYMPLNVGSNQVQCTCVKNMPSMAENPGKDYCQNTLHLPLMQVPGDQHTLCTVTEHFTMDCTDHTLHSTTSSGASTYPRALVGQQRASLSAQSTMT